MATDWTHHQDGFDFRIERCRSEPCSHVRIFCDNLRREQRSDVTRILMAGATASVTGRNPISGAFIYQVRIRMSMDSFVARHLRARGWPIPKEDK